MNHIMRKIFVLWASFVVLVYMLYILFAWLYGNKNDNLTKCPEHAKRISLWQKSKFKVKVKSETQEKNKIITRRRKWVIGCRACRSSVHMGWKTIVHIVLVDSLQIATLIYKILRKKGHKGERGKGGKKRLDWRKTIQIYQSYRESYGVSAETRWGKKRWHGSGQKKRNPNIQQINMQDIEVQLQLRLKTCEFLFWGFVILGQKKKESVVVSSE